MLTDALLVGVECAVCEDVGLRDEERVSLPEVVGVGVPDRDAVRVRVGVGLRVLDVVPVFDAGGDLLGLRDADCRVGVTDGVVVAAADALPLDVTVAVGETDADELHVTCAVGEPLPVEALLPLAVAEEELDGEADDDCDPLELALHRRENVCAGVVVGGGGAHTCVGARWRAPLQRPEVGVLQEGAGAASLTCPSESACACG